MQDKPSAMQNQPSPDHQHADLIIKAGWIAPVAPETGALADHALVVRGDTIVDLLPTPLADQKWRADEVVELGNHLLIPGLVNAHTHAAMNLFRGLADDLPLMTWLEQHIWPAEGQWMSEAFVRDGTRLAAAEMIRSGTTCFADMYFFPETTARVAMEAGLRAVLFSPILDFPTPMGAGPDDYLRLATEAADNWRHEPRVTIGFGPHAPYTVSDGPLEKVLTLAEELDAPLMMHEHETAGEIHQAVETSGERPLTRLKQLGLLNPRLLAVHMTQLLDEEIQWLGETRTAALLAKGVSLRADAVPAATALRMATLNGARALGLESRTGSLEIGKQADMIAVDLGALETQPVYDPVAQLVYAATRDQVTHSWVAGRCLMADRRLTTLNAALIAKNAAEWQRNIAPNNDRANNESR